MTPLRPVDHHTRQQLNEHLASIEGALDADVLTIITPILSGLENAVKNAVEMFKDRHARMSVILETPGGIVEVVERMVHVIRHHYGEVYFVVPDHAMSVGTVFVMSGDKIFMNYSSCLGPIDPQIEKDGKLVPALSYLN
jgi:ClpP class serine protease